MAISFNGSANKINNTLIEKNSIQETLRRSEELDTIKNKEILRTDPNSIKDFFSSEGQQQAKSKTFAPKEFEVEIVKEILLQKINPYNYPCNHIAYYSNCDEKLITFDEKEKTYQFIFDKASNASVTIYACPFCGRQLTHE